MWRMTLLEMEWLAGVITFLTDESELLLVLILSLYSFLSLVLCAGVRGWYIYTIRICMKENCVGVGQEKEWFTHLYRFCDEF